MTTLEARDAKGEQTLVFIYYSGHGWIDQQQLVGLNDPSKTNRNKDAFTYPLERDIRNFVMRSTYVIALFDCCRALKPKELTVTKGEETDECQGNLVLIYGTSPLSAVRADSPIAESFEKFCKQIKEQNGGFVSLSNLLFFKAKDVEIEITKSGSTQNIDIPYQKQIQSSEPVAQTKTVMISDHADENEPLPNDYRNFVKKEEDYYKYHGEMKNDKFQGRGVYQNDYFFRHYGHYADGRKDGVGVQTYGRTTRKSRKGEWKDGFYSGMGIIEWMSGAKTKELCMNRKGGYRITTFTEEQGWFFNKKQVQVRIEGFFKLEEERTWRQMFIGEVPKYENWNGLCVRYDDDVPVEYALYEHKSHREVPKKVKVFDETEVKAINNKQLDPTIYFEDSYSKNYLATEDMTFNAPKDFNERYEQVEKKILEVEQFFYILNKQENRI